MAIYTKTSHINHDFKSSEKYRVNCPQLGDIPYIIDLSLALKAARESAAKRIVVQMPDGLKPYSINIISCLEDNLADAEIYLHSDSTFGACDLQYGQLEATLKPDLIIHIGHTPYPAELAHKGLEPRNIKVVYVPALSVLDPSRESIVKAGELLKKYGARRIAIAATAQHTHKVRKLSTELSKLGFEVAIPRGLTPFFTESQIIGCDYRLPRSVKNVDAYVYLGSGVFHPLGLYLSTFKPVIRVDPYRGDADDLTPYGEKLYRNRLHVVARAMDASRWGLIVGLKTGQYRPWLVKRLEDAIKAKNGSFVRIASEVLTEKELVNIDNDWFDAFIVTSCPRLPTDDFWNYHKPVLTPGEAFMALSRKLEPYRFPW